MKKYRGNVKNCRGEFAILVNTKTEVINTTDTEIFSSSGKLAYSKRNGIGKSISKLTRSQAKEIYNELSENYQVEIWAYNCGRRRLKTIFVEDKVRVVSNDNGFSDAMKKKVMQEQH